MENLKTKINENIFNSGGWFYPYKLMIFERAKYKEYALRQLKGRWTVPVLMTFIICLFIGVFSIPDLVRLFSSTAYNELVSSDFETLNDIFVTADKALTQSSTNLSSLIQSLVEAILVMASLNVYIKYSRSPEKVSFASFIEGLNNWWRAAFCCIYKTIFIVLWTFVFFIPGIIKTYAYSQMEYLLVEFPDLSVRKAMELSKILTNGHKWDLFIMDLSFLGWEIVCAFTCGIGQLWLRPYKHMTKVNAYHAMLQDAYKAGLIKQEDLQ